MAYVIYNIIIKDSSDVRNVKHNFIFDYLSNSDMFQIAACRVLTNLRGSRLS